MDLITGTPDWDVVEDRDLWNQFLRSRTGQRLFAKALDSQPGLLARGTDNEIFIRSGEVRGWTACISTLVALSLPEPAITGDAPPENYPDLTDDEAWKLKQPTE